MLALSTKLRGIVPWVLKDFRTPLRTHPDYQEYYNRKGLVDENGAPKAAFGVLKNLFEGMGDALALPRRTPELSKP